MARPDLCLPVRIGDPRRVVVGDCADRAAGAHVVDDAREPWRRGVEIARPPGDLALGEPAERRGARRADDGRARLLDRMAKLDQRADLHDRGER